MRHLHVSELRGVVMENRLQVRIACYVQGLFVVDNNCIGCSDKA